MRALEQADTGSKRLVRAGQAGTHERQEISPSPQMVSLLPVPKLPAVTDTFSVGQRPACPDKLRGLWVQLMKLAQGHAEQHRSARSALAAAWTRLAGLWKGV